MSRIPAVLLAVALAAQTGCGHQLSANQSNGMMYAGGAITFMGSIVTVDGLSCNEVAGGEQQCGEDNQDLKGGLAVMGVGIAIGVIGYLLRPQAHAEATAPMAASK